MRRSRTSGTSSAVLAVHSVGTGASSSSRFMNSFDPSRAARRVAAEEECPARIRQQVGHLVEQEEGIPTPREQALCEREFAEPFQAVRLPAPPVALADAEQGHAEPRGHGPAELRLSGAGRAVEEDVDAGLPGLQRPPEEPLDVIPAFRDVVEISPFERRPVRLAEEDVPDPEIPAGQVGEAGETLDEREVAVVVDRHEARPHQRRLRREAHGDRAVRHVEKIGQRGVPHVEFRPAAAPHEHVDDQRFDDRLGLVQQQDLQDADVRRGHPGDADEALQPPRRQVGSRPSRPPRLVRERLPERDPAVVAEMRIAGVGDTLPPAPAADDPAGFLVVENGGVVGDPGRQIGGGGIAPVEAPGGVREPGEQKAALVRAKHRISPAVGTVQFLPHPCVSSGRADGGPAGDEPSVLLSVNRDGRHGHDKHER